MVKNGCCCPFSVLNEKKAFHMHVTSSFHVGAITWQQSLNLANFVTLLTIQVVHIQLLLISIVGKVAAAQIAEYHANIKVP
jgi:hypothetical protein